MAKIPVRFKRVAAAFNEISRARICSESSGSDHSADDSADLSDLVDSFIERDGNHHPVEGETENEVEKVRTIDSDSDKYWSDSETKDMLQSLLLGTSDNLNGGNGDERKILRKIRGEIENICRFIGSSDGFKRELMGRLRERGFDAGLCKSRWDKTGRYPAGTFEYIDIIVSGTRYIIEVNLAGEFTIARPTTRYDSLLEVFPKIFVGKPDKLKQVVRLMCAAAKESMKSSDMHVAPWRRNGYMQAKWLSSYKRTTNSTPARNVSNSDEILTGKRSVGFDTSPAILYNCRSEFGRKQQVVGMRVGKLAEAFNGIES